MARQLYVLGFAFGKPFGAHGERDVLLIKKVRPDWQAGKLNGIGGHVESGELLLDAMVREFEEETGIPTEKREWQMFAELTGDGWACFVFRAFDLPVIAAMSITEEEVQRYVPSLLPPYTLPSVRYLIPMALDPTIKDLPVRLTYR